MLRWAIVHWPVTVAAVVCAMPFLALGWILIDELIDQRHADRQRAVREEMEL